MVVVVEVDEKDEFFGFVVAEGEHEVGIDVDSFEVLQRASEILVVFDGDFVALDDLDYLIL